MLGEPCKACGAPIDMPTGKLCRKCYNVYKKALPGYQKNLQEKAWKNRPSYQKRLQEKAWANTPSYQKYLQEKDWTTYPKTCEACGAAYEAHNKYSRLCPVCYARQIELKTTLNTRGRYKQLRINGRKITEHRYLAEQIFGRALTPDEHIHHLNKDPKHNDLSNLIVLSNSNHHRLHHYLDVQQVIEEKRVNPRPWYEIVGMLSLRWLRDNNTPYFRLSDLKASKDNLIAELGVSGHLGALYPILNAKIHEALYPNTEETAKEHSEDS